MAARARDPALSATVSLRDEVATLIIAGHETTAATLFWACYAAARLPEHGERIAEEAAGVDLSADNAAAAVKRLRYVLEVTAPCFGPYARTAAIASGWPE